RPGLLHDHDRRVGAGVFGQDRMAARKRGRRSAARRRRDRPHARGEREEVNHTGGAPQGGPHYLPYLPPLFRPSISGGRQNLFCSSAQTRPTVPSPISRPARAKATARRKGSRSETWSAWAARITVSSWLSDNAISDMETSC